MAVNEDKKKHESPPCAQAGRRRAMLPAMLDRLAGAMTESDFRSHPGGLPRNTVLERRASLTARVREFGGNIDTGN